MRLFKKLTLIVLLITLFILFDECDSVTGEVSLSWEHLGSSIEFDAAAMLLYPRFALTAPGYPEAMFTTNVFE